MTNYGPADAPRSIVEPADALVKQFVDERSERIPSRTEKGLLCNGTDRRTVWKAFQMWCTEQNQHYPFGRTSFYNHVYYLGGIECRGTNPNWYGRKWKVSNV